MADGLSRPIGPLMGLHYKSHFWHWVFNGKYAPVELTAFIEVVSTDKRHDLGFIICASAFR